VEISIAQELQVARSRQRRGLRTCSAQRYFHYRHCGHTSCPRPIFCGAIRTLCLTIFILPGEIAVCGCPVFVLGVIDTGSTISGRELSGFNNQIPARTRTSCLVSETKTGCSETKTGRSEKNLEWQFAANIFASV